VVKIQKSAFKNDQRAGHWWLKPVILAAQGAEIQEDCGSKPAWASSSQDPILKKLMTKTKGLVEWLKM
jgi:hypothetical protein